MTTPTGLYRALVAEGFVFPDETADLELLMPPGGVLQLRYTVNVTGEHLARLTLALMRLREEELTNARR